MTVPPLPSPQSDPPPDAILEILLGNVRTGVLAASIELDVWGRIARGARTAGDLARDGSSPDGIRRLLDALCALGLLTKDGDGYVLTAVSKTYLVPGEASYMGDFVLANLAWDGKGGLASGIRTGRRPLTGPWTGEGSSAAWAQWCGPDLAFPERRIEEAIGMWREAWLETRAGTRVLDIACGSGVKTLALARGNPRVRITLQDWPEVIDRAREIARRLGVEHQVEFLPAGWEQADYGKERFDAAFLGFILHYLAEDEVVQLLGKVHASIVPGGMLLVLEDAPDEERRSAEYALLESVWLYGVTRSGDTYTVTELSGFLERSGFEVPTVIRETGTGSLLRARKSLRVEPRKHFEKA